MSEEMICDGCSKEGRRRRGHYCPEGWFILMAIPEGGTREDEGVIVMVACTMTCAMGLWTQGSDGSWTLTATDNEEECPPVLVKARNLEEASSLWVAGEGKRLSPRF